MAFQALPGLAPPSAALSSSTPSATLPSQSRGAQPHSWNMPHPLPFCVFAHTAASAQNMPPVSSGWGTSDPPLPSPQPPLCLPSLATVIIRVVYGESHVIRNSLAQKEQELPADGHPNLTCPAQCGRSCFSLILVITAVELKPDHLLVCSTGGNCGSGWWGLGTPPWVSSGNC